MNNQSTSNRLLLIYLITMLGSSMTTVVSFLVIERTFSSQYLLAGALSARTIAFVVYSYFVPALLNKFGERKTLLASQAFGVFALIVFYFGIKFKLFGAVVIGLILTGLPGNVTTTGLIAGLRNMIPDDSLFRKYSSNRELIAGVSLTLAGFLSPFLISQIKLEYILTFDALTYLVATAMLTFVAFPNHVDIKSNYFPSLKEYLNRNTLRFVFTIGFTMILMALLPLVASSISLQKQLNFDGKIFSTMWGVEGLTAIIASKLYPKFHDKKVFIISYFSGSLLLLTCLVNISQMKFILLSLIPLCFSMVFFDNRDSLILSAKTDRRLINSYTSVSNLIKSLFGATSPYVLMFFLNSFSLISVGIGLLGLQFVFTYFSFTFFKARGLHD